MTGGFARCEGAGAEPAQLEQWLLSLMLLHIGTALHDLAESAAQDAPAGAGDASTAAASSTALARLALHTCVMLQRPQILFERAFPLFLGAEPVTRALGSFLEVIEPAVISDVLQVGRSVFLGWGGAWFIALLHGICFCKPLLSRAVGMCVECVFTLSSHFQTPTQTPSKPQTPTPRASAPK